MAEQLERLWPEEKNQPVWEICIKAGTFSLRWEDTWVQYYRTGDERYDEKLRRYDHVIHKYAEREEGDADYVIISFEEMGELGMQFLEAKRYPIGTRPIPETYILDHIAMTEIIDVPDTVDLGLDDAAVQVEPPNTNSE